MKEIHYDFLYTPENISGAILHTHEPFIKDYLALHILLKIYKPKSILEIGTHVGEGTQIICNAIPSAAVLSLDLPPTEASKTLQHPSLKAMRVGEMCMLTYTQLWGDSMEYPYWNLSCEAWFIDGEHDYAHPRHETIEAIKQRAKLIIWHDADIPEVYNAITDSFAYQNDYELYRVTGTQIAYAIRK